MYLKSFGIVETLEAEAEDFHQEVGQEQEEEEVVDIETD